MRSTISGAVLAVAMIAASSPGVRSQEPPATPSAVAPAEAAPPAPPEQARPVRSSWTSDRHALSEGDLITILIDEYTLATANRNDLASKDKDRDLSLLGGSIGSVSGGDLRTRNDVSRRDRGEASRRERFSAEMTARVVESTPGGALRIEGTKKVQIDKHEQEVVVRGWVRAQDVSSRNTVESWRIADAEILYSSNGELVKAGGLWSKLLDLLIP